VIKALLVLLCLIRPFLAVLIKKGPCIEVCGPFSFSCLDVSWLSG
jgi:hypothetical protein